MADLRAIDVSGEAPVVPAEQSAPQLGWVKIADLRIDDAYQRPLARANWLAIRRIAAGFDWASFTPVVVAPLPGGAFALIDGQHRSHAAAICGFDSVPAMIVPIPRGGQAQAFGRINSQAIRVGAHGLYKPALAEGAAWAVDAQAAVARAGCDLMTGNRSSGEKKVGQVFCVGLVRRFVEAGKGWAVTAALEVLRSADGGRRVQLYSDYVLQPLIEAVAALDDPSHADLVRALTALDLFRVIEGARRPSGLLAKADAARAVRRALEKFVSTPRRDA